MLWFQNEDLLLPSYQPGPLCHSGHFLLKLHWISKSASKDQWVVTEHLYRLCSMCSTVVARALPSKEAQEEVTAGACLVCSSAARGGIASIHVVFNWCRLKHGSCFVRQSSACPFLFLQTPGPEEKQQSSCLCVYYRKNP